MWFTRFRMLRRQIPKAQEAIPEVRNCLFSLDSPQRRSGITEEARASEKETFLKEFT